MVRTFERLRSFAQRIGPRVRDVVVVLVSFGTALGATISEPPWSPLPRPVIFLAAMGGTAALWWRRRHPVPVVVAGLAALCLSGNPVPLVVALFGLAVARRDRVLAVAAGAAAVAFAVPSITASQWLGPLLSGGLGAGFLTAAGAYVGARRDLLASLRERAERAEAEQVLRAEQARTGERARIAREMHDVLAHKVSLIALHAGALEVATDPTAAQVEAAAALIRATARQTLEELRQVLGVLRAEEAGADGHDLAPQAQAADIERLVDQSRAAGIPVALELDAPGLPDATARAVHRIVQESLTNVHKHARGAATTVAVTGDGPAGVTVVVENRRPVAVGSLLPGSGAGLVGLAERTRLLGGRLDSGPTPDGGWRVAAWLPWSAPTTDPPTAPVPERAPAPS